MMVSIGSDSASSIGVTTTVALVWLAGMVTVPGTVSTSLPLPAVPERLNATASDEAVAAARVMVKVPVSGVAASPAVASVAAMVTDGTSGSVMITVAATDVPRL